MGRKKTACGACVDCKAKRKCKNGEKGSAAATVAENDYEGRLGRRGSSAYIWSGRLRICSSCSRINEKTGAGAELGAGEMGAYELLTSLLRA